MVCANIISFLLLYSLAAYSCQAACPGGSSDECPGDSYCYADVPCTAGATPPPIDNVSGGTTTFDNYCGTSPENAAENCWQPCRDNADCCAGQTCHAATSCPVYANNVGADHFFCGTGMIYPWRMFLPFMLASSSDIWYHFVRLRLLWCNIVLSSAMPIRWDFSECSGTNHVNVIITYVHPTLKNLTCELFILSQRFWCWMQRSITSMLPKYSVQRQCWTDCKLSSLWTSWKCYVVDAAIQTGRRRTNL